MARRGASYTLSVLLKLNDQLSGRLNKSVSALRRFEKQSDSALKTYARLRKEASRPVSTAGLARYDARVKAVGQSVRALARDAAKLNRTLGKQPSAAQRPPAPRAADGHVRAYRGIERDRLRAEREHVRLLREQVRLRQDSARLAQAERRAAGAADVHDIRLARERIRLRREQERAQRGVAPGRGPFGYRDSLGGRAQSAVAAGQSFRAAADTVADFARPAMEQMRAEARFRVMGYPEADNARGMAAVDDTVRNVRGVKRSDATETLTALTSTFGEIDQATKFLPIAAKYRANMQTLYGDMYGAAEINRQISNTFKALELLGVDRPTGPGGAFTEVDRSRMESYFNMVAQATAATGGDINASEFRAFTKYGRTSVMGLSPQGLQKLLPLIQQLGGAQTGTALMSLNQNLVGGAMPAYKLREWDRLGLLDKSKVEVTKAGLVKRMQPGAIPMASMLQTDPVAFADKLSETLRSKGVDTQDFNQVNKQISALLGNRTSAGALSQLINYRASLDKEAKNYERALSVDETHRTLFDQQNPLANFLDLQAKWNDAKAREAMGLVNKAGGAAGSASDYLASHPDVAAALSGLSALGRTSTEAASGVGLLRDALGGWRGGGSGGGGGGGGVAGTGLDVGELVIGGGWTLSKFLKFGGRLLTGGARAAGVGTAAAAGGRGMLSHPAVAIATVAAGSAYAIHSNYQRDQAERERDRAGAGTSYEGLKARRAHAGGTLPREAADQYLRQVMPQGPAALLINLEPKVYGGAGYPGVSVPAPHRNEQVVGEFRRQMPALELPEVMAAFVRMNRQLVTEGRMPAAAAERASGVAQSAFPESYRAAASQLGDEAQKLVQGAGAFNSSLGALNNYILNPLPSLAGGTAQTQQSLAATQATAALVSLASETPRTAGALDNLIMPADSLRSALARAAGGASTFAARIQSWQPPQLTFGIHAPQPAGAPAASGPGAAFSFNLPKSAAGSVVERDGLAELHRGNVVTPAKLARRTPGQWLDAASYLGGARRPAEAPAPSGLDAWPASEGADLGGINYSPHYEVSVGGAADIDAAIGQLEARQAEERARLRAEMLAALNDPRAFRRRLSDAESHRAKVA